MDLLESCDESEVNAILTRQAGIVATQEFKLYLFDQTFFPSLVILKLNKP